LWEACTKCGTGRKGKIQLELASKMKHKSPLRFHIILEGCQIVRALHHHVLLHFLIWAGSEEARNHVRKTGLLNISRTVLQNKRFGQVTGFQELLQIK